jgi:hypothetical protein
MSNWTRTFVDRLLNPGTALVLMGAQWLYLWAFPWYTAYVWDPHWGHNYAEAIAFLAAGLAYFNRRLVSDVLTFLATLLIIPASLELVPHAVTAITGALLLALIILDMFVERGRDSDLGAPSNKRLTFWLKKHLPRFSYVMLAHMALVYFFVRLPTGTYETDMVTLIYDGMLIPFAIIILLEDMPGIVKEAPMKHLGFFWGMLMMIVALLLLFDLPVTRIHLALTSAVAALGTIAFAMTRRSAAEAA